MMLRVYYPYWQWEDFKAGMWEPLKGDVRKAKLVETIKFTGDANLYGEWMLKVAKNWPIATGLNLTNASQNRKAWVGHAACFLAIGSPEDLTREAWGFLSHAQQDEANQKAQQAIQTWEAEYEEKNTQLCFDLD